MINFFVSWVFYSIFLSSADFLLTFSKNAFRITTRVSTGLDLDQTWRSVQAWSGSKLFAKINSRRKKAELTSIFIQFFFQSKTLIYRKDITYLQNVIFAPPPVFWCKNIFYSNFNTLKRPKLIIFIFNKIDNRWKGLIEPCRIMWKRHGSYTWSSIALKSGFLILCILGNYYSWFWCRLLTFFRF